MTSDEIRAGSNGLVSQIRGIFPFLEQLPKALEDIEARERACVEREAKAASLDADIKSKQSQLNSISTIVADKMRKEELQSRSELEVSLSGLRAQIAADELRAATAKAAGDKAESRLRTLQDTLNGLGLKA